MARTRKRQKTRGGEKKLRASPSVTSSSSSPLQAFFADYAPQFQYNATVSAPWEFYRLCDELGWDKEDSDRKEAHQNFKDALVQQFNVIYGKNVNDLVSWQSLCHAVRIDPIPDDLHACREAVHYSFVNLVDLVDIHTTREEVHVFESEKELSKYTLSTGKIFPRENMHAGSLLRHLLRHIRRPRDGYDVTHRGGKQGRSKRR